jgi:hypothetical protein
MNFVESVLLDQMALNQLNRTISGALDSTE